MCCRRGLIRLAKAKPDARVLPGQDCMRKGVARQFAAEFWLMDMAYETPPIGEKLEMPPAAEPKNQLSH